MKSLLNMLRDAVLLGAVGVGVLASGCGRDTLNPDLVFHTGGVGGSNGGKGGKGGKGGTGGKGGVGGTGGVSGTGGTGGNPFCGDGSCDQGIGENVASCPIDCPGGFCGDDYCAPGEVGICPECLDNTCGNGACDGQSDYFNCPWECGIFECGNGQCDMSDYLACPWECQPSTCGNLICDNPSDLSFCPWECGQTTCGNNQCDSADYQQCPGECGVNTYGNRPCAFWGPFVNPTPNQPPSPTAICDWKSW